MNETEANEQLKELATTHRKARLDVQDYRHQRRAILTRFSASNGDDTQETLEWLDPTSRGEDTAELQVPENVDDTAEIKVVNGTRQYTIWAVTAAALFAVGVLLWRLL